MDLLLTVSFFLVIDNLLGPTWCDRLCQITCVVVEKRVCCICW